MTEYKLSYATVRIHGDCNMENIEAASKRFLKQVIKQKKEKAKCSKLTK